MRTWVVFLLGVVLLGLTGPPVQAVVAAPASASGDRAPAAVRPVPGPVVRGFDPPDGPYGPGHRGVDLAAEPGDVVRAALPGTVSFAGLVAQVGWVTVDHGAGLSTTYGDLEPRQVVAGQRVGAGQPIGRIAEGASHLDWGARLDGTYIDPLALLAVFEVRLVAPRAP